MKILKNTYRITLSVASILLLIFTLTGCGGSFSKPAAEEIKGSGSRPKPDYDPISTTDDKLIIPEQYPAEIAAVSDTSWLVDSVRILPQHFDDIDSTSNLYSRYRIQLFSSNTYGPAVRERDIAKEVFDQKVYLDYEVPYYKIRVGDFNNRLDAEKYLPAARQAGYNTAWVVKVALDVNTLDDIYNEDDIPEMDIPDKAEDSLYTEPVPSDEYQNDQEN